MLCAASQLVQSQGLHGSLLASLVLGPPVTLEAEINSAMSELWTISELWTMKGRRRDPAVFLDVFRLWRSEICDACFRRFAKPELRKARMPNRVASDEIVPETGTSRRAVTAVHDLYTTAELRIRISIGGPTPRLEPGRKRQEPGAGAGGAVTYFVRHSLSISRRAS